MSNTEQAAIFNKINNKYGTDNLGIQYVYTPTNKIEEATGIKFFDFVTPETKNIGVLFNWEFIYHMLEEALKNNYTNNMQFTYFYDSEADKEALEVLNSSWFYKSRFAKVNYEIELVNICEFTEKNNDIKVIEKAMTGKHFDIVFSNPPYNDGLDLKILSSIKNNFKKAIIVHPAVWILSNKESGKFENFKKEFQNNIEKVLIFRGNMFGVPFMSALDICVFNNEKTDTKIEVDDQVTNCKYTVENYKDITHYGDMWFKVGIKDFIEKCKSYKSILDVENRFPHFKFPNKINFPINITEFRAGNPHFNDGYFDEKLGYYVLNKTNYFFTCIAKGDPEKYHFKFDNKHVVLSYNFNTAVERLNFYNYCKSKIFRFILSYLKVNAHNNTGELKNTPWLDFTQEWDDAKLCKEFGIDKELWQYIDKFIPDYYEDYESGFESKTIVSRHQAKLPNDEIMKFCPKDVLDYIISAEITKDIFVSKSFRHIEGYENFNFQVFKYKTKTPGIYSWSLVKHVNKNF